MKKAYKFAVAALAVCLVIFHFAVPQKAVKGEYRLHRVEKNSQDITGQLSEETLMQIKELVENAESTRWKNPLGAVPAYKDTVILLGMDDRGPCNLVLAGSSGQYGVENHIIKDGEALWKAVLKILP